MDFWIVAAAAGAGYVAQRLKNLKRGQHKSFDLSPEDVRTEVENNSCPLRRVLWRKQLGDEMSARREKAFESSSAGEMASTSGYEDENLVMKDNFPSFSMVSNSSSLSECMNNVDFKGDCEGRLPSNFDGVFTNDSLPSPSSSGREFSYGFRRNISSLRSRRINSQFIKPRTSLESCLMAQLYEQHAEIEEYTYSVQPLPKPTVRSFLVTDGSRIVSTAPQESFLEPTRMGKCKLLKNTYSQENKSVLGVPRLVPVELRKKVKARNRKEQVLKRSGTSKMANGDHNNAQCGTAEKALLFYLGVTMGMISSFLANKQEMEKLNKLLKQNENLVQDLQEELEMKDSLTVKELTVKDYEPQDVHIDCYFDDAVHALPAEHNSSEQNRGEKADNESYSKIEAELEAELERLESNMNSSSLEGKLSNFTELDRDLEFDFLKGKYSGNHPYTDRYVESSSSVSPRELSLRLHELIQTRLEQRVKELETALEKSQRKLKKYMESESSNNKTRTFSTHAYDSPICKDGQESCVDEPVINLSGEALSAYNEAYEEFAKDEDDLQFGFENDDDYVEKQCSVFYDERTEEDVVVLSNNSSRDESEDDEMEKLLIREIVEKAKQGSPAILKAQRALLAIDENEH